MNKRRKTRHVLDWLLTVSIAGSLSLLLFLGWIWYGVFNQSALNDWLNETGYYEKRYEQFMGEIDACLEYLKVPKESLDLESIHTRFLIASKNEVFRQKMQDTASWNMGNEIRTQLEQYFKEQNVTLTEQAEQGMKELETFLNQAFTRYTETSEIEGWSLKRDALQEKLIKKCIVFGMICLIGSLMLLAIQHRKSLTWKYLGTGIAAAGLIILLKSVYGTWSNVAEGNFLEQVYQKNGYFIGGIVFLIGVSAVLIPWLLDSRK